MKTQQEITEAIRKRKRKLDARPYLPDHEGVEIFNALKAQIHNLPTDFIMESLTKIGLNPQLFYDDNGRFALIEPDAIPTISGSMKLNGQYNIVFTTTVKDWQPTIRKAVQFYITKTKFQA